MSYDVPDLSTVIAEQPNPLVFATVSGAHLYGFPSRDSDVDLRGVHILPLAEVIGLRPGPETLQRMWVRDGVELDLVTHDVLKFARLLLRPNGYVLEQLMSPLIAHTTPAHQELRSLARSCTTTAHAHHYHGFARTQWRLFEKTGELKPLLYTFRVLLTGIHLMCTGEVESHLPTLIETHRAPPYLPDLIKAKTEAEHTSLPTTPTTPSPTRLQTDVTHWHNLLDEARQTSPLPDSPTAEPALNHLVQSLRHAA